MFIIVESILRKTPELKAEVVDILRINTEVEIIEIIENIDEKESYAKIRYKEKEGYVLKTSLEKNKIICNENKNESITVQEKTKMINEAIRILNQHTEYSSKIDNKFYENGKTRANGYYNIPYLIENGIEFYSYDCSAFCDTILNRVFKENMQRRNREQVEVKDGLFKPNLWVTRDYFESSVIEKEEKKFDVIEYAKEENQEIHIENMEIGDFILGIIDYENEKHDKKFIMNHIMMYIGDKYFVHSSFSDGENIFNRVLMSKIVDDFYTKVSFEKRFDKSILIIRYKTN